MARPTKFTPKYTKKLIAGLRDGMTRRAACASAGIANQTFLDWFHDPDRLNFREQVETAENEAEARYTNVIKKAAFGHEVVIEKTVTKADGSVIRTREVKMEYSWQAALEWIKRRRRADWGDKIDINLDSEIEKTLVALQQVTTDDPPTTTDPTLH